MKAEITLIEDDSDLYNLLRYAFESGWVQAQRRADWAPAPDPSNPQFIHALRVVRLHLREGA